MDSPEYVQRAQRYVQSLTGDDASYNENPVLAGQNLVRLTGLKSGTNAAAQSQLSLRSSGGGGSFPGQPQSIASTSTGTGGQQLPLGILNRGLTGFSGYGQGSGGGSGGGLGGGSGSGSLTGGGGTTVNTGGGDNGNQNPITPTDPAAPANIVINNNPVFNNNNNNANTNNNNPVNNNTNQQNQNQNQNQSQSQNQNQNGCCNPGEPNPPDGGNNPVPAPPAAVLGMVALGMFGIRKLRGRKQNS